ncbi:MAG: response regulator transcription factor [Lachnospiraceae bacterium]|nr:response regulator transcription factor [Lachnospiraceae bacterium]
MKKITIIEDDTDIRNMITKFLINQKYEVCSAPNGKEGIELCKRILPDIIILDLMLPALSGDNVLKQLRTFTNIPVIVVSAKTMVQSKIDLLRMGADDYMTKPFNLYELLARIEANLKRSVPASQKEDLHLRYKDIEIENCTVYIKGTMVQFTSTELAILILLLQYPQKIFSKQNLYESIWQEEYAYDNDTINTHISNIRKKIKRYTDTDYIETVWGIGYKLK